MHVAPYTRIVRIEPSVKLQPVVVLMGTITRRCGSWRGPVSHPRNRTEYGGFLQRSRTVFVVSRVGAGRPGVVAATQPGNGRVIIQNAINKCPI